MTKLQQKLAHTYEEDGYSATLTFWAENQDEINALSEKERTALKNMMSRYCRINGDEKNAAILLAEKQNPQKKEIMSSLFELARIYNDGKSVDKNALKSERLYELLFEGGDSDDLYKLGEMYKSGDGVPNNERKAAECFKKSAFTGNKLSAYRLGEMYMIGCGVEKSRVEAEKWYITASSEKSAYLSRMSIPDGIDYVSESAFKGFENLSTVVIPQSVKNIGSKAFANCRNLKSVNFQNQKIRVSYDSFSACENLDDETKTLVKKFSSSTEMIFVEGGTFERAGYSITVSSFEIGKFPVTQKLYDEVMGENPSKFKGENNPVENVSWYDAVKFCNELSKKDGLEPCYSGIGSYTNCDFSKNGYRLLTEAEWEFAARGGNKSNGYEYSGSNNIDEVAWYCHNSKKSHEVGQKKPNELGIYDMSGNVWEWCNDLYGYYGYGDKNNPHGASSGYDLVIRGGAWNGDDNCCTVSYRFYREHYYHRGTLGFRIVRNVD